MSIEGTVSNGMNKGLRLQGPLETLLAGPLQILKNKRCTENTGDENWARRLRIGIQYLLL